MLAIMVALCAWSSVVSHRAETQRRAVNTIKAAGGAIWYEYQTDVNGVAREAMEGNPPPGPAWVRNLIGLDCLASVRCISVDVGSADPHLFNSIADLPQIRSLVCYGPGVTDSALATLSTLREVRRLILNDTAVTENGWRPLRQFVDLQVLSLEGNNVNDSALVSIEGLTSLKSLNLSQARVTDSGLEHIERLSGLEDLYIRGHITDAGLRHLRGLNRLKMLDLSGTMVTPAGARALKQVLPNVTVYQDLAEISR